MLLAPFLLKSFNQLRDQPAKGSVRKDSYYVTASGGFRQGLGSMDRILDQDA
jgi:hypothetical protein